MDSQFRKEKDSIGELLVPNEAYYGVQSLRAIENFPITGRKMIKEFIDAMAELKKACAIANSKAGVIPEDVAKAIEDACDDILNGKYYDEFVVDPIQGSAGTSMNMNANEVIANIAIEKLGGKKGDYSIVHPNDSVNQGQSTNDIIPTAGKLATLKLLKTLEPSIENLIKALDEKAVEFDDIVKMGRTQLEDAVPIRLGQEFAAWSSAVKRALGRIKDSENEMLVINMGATAIGTGINADIDYYNNITPVLSEISGFEFSQAKDMIDGTQHTDCFAAVSSALRNCAIALSKICNDLRLMASGPRTGLAEINLPARQNGSSIMPGKVNPVIPEVVNQVAFMVVGNDVTISMAAEAGQFELNAFEPITFDCLFQSISCMKNAIDTLTVNCIQGITANRDVCELHMAQSVGIVTAICPFVGYQKAADAAKKALKTGVPIRDIVLEEGLMSKEDLDKVLDPFALTKPGVPEI